jgi:hypothetical protein
MQIGPLDLPEELLTALEEKRLVIFAGAGVSIPPPASLPSFQCLVEQLVGRHLSPEEHGQMDRVLGREKERGLPVHQLAAEYLSRPGSRFNSVHESLVTLFGSTAALRIVTSNFDLHFEGARAAHPELGSVEVYTAPALPLGSSFTGLVHLHGALGRPPDELVLTDADFGRAYLSEGWAGRFVLDLFREFTVLFVGYSYGDTVMSYLTRGLAPSFGRQRFALTELGQREKWELLGIQPVEYDSADGHRALAHGLTQWASLERRGFVDWNQRLPLLVGREPHALAPDEQGELEFCLKNPKRAKLFYHHAKRPGWLEWAEQQGRLRPLFTFEGDQDALRELATWFTEDPLGERGKVSLQIALTSIRPVGPALALLASQQVWSALGELKTVDATHAQVAAAWATILTERTAPNTLPAYLGDWLEYLSTRDHPHLVTQILAHLLRCQPVFRGGALWGLERDLGLSVETPGLDRNLGEHWSKVRAHVSVLAWPLVPVITEVCEARWRWLVNLEARTSRSDPWGWRRSWVEIPPGESSRHGTLRNREPGPLLDIGKDVLDELLAHSPDRAAAVIEQWLAAGAPQLVQLGLYGLAKSTRWKPGRKIERLMAEHLPAGLPFKVEAFRVLRESYPLLSPRQRERFLKRTERLYRGAIDKRSGEPGRQRTKDYEWFNVLVWLQRADPDDPLLAQAIAALRQSHPEFQSRDHPELDIDHGEGVRWKRSASPIKSEEIAGLSLSQWLDELRASHERQRQEGFATDHVRGFHEETARAATVHLDWGLSLARGLLARGDFEHEVWQPLFASWKGRAFAPGEWEQLLGVLEVPEFLTAQPSGVAELIRGLAEQKDPRPTEAMLLSGLLLAERVLPLVDAVPLSFPTENVDWLAQAINHPGGQLAEFVILAIGGQLGPSANQGSGIPTPCRPLLDAISIGTGRASAMGRVVLASRAHYLLWVDPDWTRARLLPLFGWGPDPLQAVQAWHGLLFWGRPGAALLEALTPAAVQLASHLQELGSEREHYGSFIARAALSLPDDPLDKAWFKSFLALASDDDRARFAWEIDELAESLRPEQKAEIWRDWLCRYLERRAGFPPAPGGWEFTALVQWAFSFSGQLQELVERLEPLPGSGAADLHLLWSLQQGELPGSDANLLGRLVLALLRRCATVGPGDLPALRLVIERLIDEGAADDFARELIDRYVEHGGLKQQELLDRLGARGT